MNQSQSRAGIGVSSVLMVLVVLAMAALAMLSFTSAQSTRAMTQRNAEVSAAYYRAAATVQERLMAIDQATLGLSRSDLLEAYDTMEIPDVEWREEDGGLFFTVTVPVIDDQSLIAGGEMLFQENARYRLTSHALGGDALGEQDEYLNLIGD